MKVFTLLVLCGKFHEISDDVTSIFLNVKSTEKSNIAFRILRDARPAWCWTPYNIPFSIFTFLFLDVIKGVWYIAVGLVAAVEGISVVYQEDELFKI